MPPSIPSMAPSSDSNVAMRACIVASDDHQYSVAFASADGTRVVPQELLLRFVVHYYARVLYELARVHEVRDLPARIDTLTSAEPRLDPDCFAIAGVRGKLVDVVARPIGEMSLVLESVGAREYELRRDIQLRGRTLRHSTLAVLQKALWRVTPDMAVTILAALAHMNASYRVRHRYTDPRSCREVPAIACKAAAFV
jgi:hypothetical protein